MKTTIEYTTFKERGDSDYEMYINEESKYSDFYNNTNKKDKMKLLRQKTTLNVNSKRQI